MERIVEALEHNHVYRTTVLCEPQLGKRGLYPSSYFLYPGDYVMTLRNVLAYADGTLSLLEIADVLKKPIWTLYEIVKTLLEKGLIAQVD